MEIQADQKILNAKNIIKTTKASVSRWAHKISILIQHSLYDIYSLQGQLKFALKIKFQYLLHGIGAILNENITKSSGN